MLSIIIADPDSTTRKALTLLLQRKFDMGGIVQVGDVEMLICALAKSPPDLLLLDWRLYGSPAPATCHLLQRAYPHLKIVLLSVDADDEAEAKEAGVDFVHKGASPDKLVATLELLLKNPDKNTDMESDATK